MRVLFYWQMMSGYMAACWRELANRPGIDLMVVARRPEGGSPVDFKAGLMEGINCHLVTTAELNNTPAMLAIAREHNPDVVVFCGWGTPSFVTMASSPVLQSARCIMTMDTPYSGTLRQRVGGIAKRSYFKRFDHVVVAGERTHRLAVSLGFPESIITRGVYSVDGLSFEQAIGQRAAAGPWPEQFLYVGRYAQVKAIDVLAHGYRLYRERCAQDNQRPWGLTTCGKGDEGRHFVGLDGHTDLGFTQPEALPGIMARSGAFVIASRYEPWGTVLAEAGFAGLPIVCTEACSAHLDVVRTYYNGVVTPTDDAQAFADGLRWIHDRRDMAHALGARSRALADPYGASVWADRWQGVLGRLDQAAATPRSTPS